MSKSTGVNSRQKKGKWRAIFLDSSGGDDTGLDGQGRGTKGSKKDRKGKE